VPREALLFQSQYSSRFFPIGDIGVTSKGVIRRRTSHPRRLANSEPGRTLRRITH